MGELSSNCIPVLAITNLLLDLSLPTIRQSQATEAGKLSLDGTRR